MNDSPDSYSFPEIVRLIKTLTIEVKDLRKELHTYGGTFVRRGEFDVWKAANDREIVQLRRDITSVRSSVAPVKTSPWVAAGVIIAALTGLGSLLSVFLVLIPMIR